MQRRFVANDVSAPGHGVEPITASASLPEQPVCVRARECVCRRSRHTRATSNKAVRHAHKQELAGTRQWGGGYEGWEIVKRQTAKERRDKGGKLLEEGARQET
jgi:hypothetical protein